MKVLARWTALAVLLLSAVVAAQTPDLNGQWQGTLEVGQSLRLVIVVSTNAAGGGYAATLYSIDQTPAGIATHAPQGGPSARRDGTPP